MTRHELQAELISQMIDDMDLSTMTAILADCLSESYDRYSDKELNEEVKEYYPNLLDA
jgi:hypothetical protein